MSVWALATIGVGAVLLVGSVMWIDQRATKLLTSYSIPESVEVLALFAVVFGVVLIIAGATAQHLEI